jgi:chorismate synthase
VNSIGQLFRVTSFGESHGSHVGCVIDGCPAGLSVDEDAIQTQVNRRKTGMQHFATQRAESDKVEIISGLFEGKTTGSPITILMANTDSKPADYDVLRELYRPNHADYTYQQKYQHRDHRGGGRSSIRITAPLVAAGDIARQVMQKVEVYAFVSQIGEVSMSEKYAIPNESLHQIDESIVRCPDPHITQQMLAQIDFAKQNGDTLGGVITCVVKGVPAGWGDPVFAKLQAKLAHAMLSINSVKGFEYGFGFDSAAMLGSVYNDQFEQHDTMIRTKTNHSGGIQGGISNGMDIYFRVAFKPISSIQQQQDMLHISGQISPYTISGRHDVCAVPRAVPIVEAYTFMVLADAFLIQKNNTL